MYSFHFNLFLFIYFQLSTNKVVVVVAAVFLSLAQKWTSSHLTNVDIFNLLFQLILWSYILMTGLSKVAKTHLLLCDVKCLLSYSHVSDSLKNIAKSAANTQSCLLEDFVTTLWGTLFIIRRPFTQRFIRWFDVICISTSSNFASARFCSVVPLKSVYANTTWLIYFLMLSVCSDLKQKKYSLLSCSVYFCLFIVIMHERISIR